MLFVKVWRFKKMWILIFFFFLQLGEPVSYDKITDVVLKNNPPRAVHE